MYFKDQIVFYTMYSSKFCTDEETPICPHPTMSAYFGIQGFLDADSSLDASLSSLDLSHDALNVLELIAPIPKDSRVLDHLWEKNQQKMK